MTNPTRPQSPARRRLARGALATPAVLASITSKNALAGNYHCSTSGAQSGNMSHKHKDVGCYDVGHPCSYWKDYYKSKDKTRKFSDCMGSEFGYKGKTESDPRGKSYPTKARRANANCRDSGWAAATCDHIFNGEDHASYSIGSQELRLLHAGLCAYLNAEKYPSSYHISKEDAKGLLKGALGQGSFVKAGKVWTTQQCREHLEMLFF